MLTNPGTRERRRAERSTGLEVIEISVAGSDERRIGIIRDRTDYGARVQFRSAEGLPKTVTVYSKSIGEGVPAKVCWQRGCDAGLRF